MNPYIDEYQAYCNWLIEKHTDGNEICITTMARDLFHSTMEQHEMAENLFFAELTSGDNVRQHAERVASQIIEHYIS